LKAAKQNNQKLNSHRLKMLFLGFVLSSTAFATDLDNISKAVQAVCQSPSQQGKYWNVTATGKAGANGTIRLASVGVNGEATFSKGEWEGVQQVLKAHQAGDNASYRICAEKLMPLFLANFAKATPAAKPVATKKPKAVQSPKPAAAKLKPAKKADVQQETHGDKSPAINANGDVNINY
jgi:hypothetical protein